MNYRSEANAARGKQARLLSVGCGGNGWLVLITGPDSKGKNPGFCRFKPTGRGAWKDGRVRGGGGSAEGEGGS